MKKASSIIFLFIIIKNKNILLLNYPDIIINNKQK